MIYSGILNAVHKVHIYSDLIEFPRILDSPFEFCLFLLFSFYSPSKLNCQSDAAACSPLCSPLFPILSAQLFCAHTQGLLPPHQHHHVPLARHLHALLLRPPAPPPRRRHRRLRPLPSGRRLPASPVPRQERLAPRPPQHRRAHFPRPLLQLRLSRARSQRRQQRWVMEQLAIEN